MIKSFTALKKALEEETKRPKRARMAVLYPTRPKYINAVAKATEKKYIDPILIGPKEQIDKAFSETDSVPGKFEIIHASNLEQSLTAAINTKPDCLMKGDIPTRKFAETLSDPIYDFSMKGRLMTHIGVVKVKGYKRLMFITDGAVHASPNAAKKIRIVQNAAVLANRLGIEKPKAAMLAAVEAIYPAVPVTMEEAAIAKMSERGQIKGVEIDGPLSFDCAIDKKVAKAKGLANSTVAGQADIFAMPSIETANGTYKAMVMYAGAEGGCLLYGGMIPIAGPYSVDNEKNVFNAILLAAYLA